jgi:hypothetical protein
MNHEAYTLINKVLKRSNPLGAEAAVNIFYNLGDREMHILYCDSS